MTDSAVVAGPVDLSELFRDLLVDCLHVIGLSLLAVVAVMVVACMLLAVTLGLIRLARGQSDDRIPP